MRKITASWNQKRRKWEAKGIGQVTLKRRTYYGDTEQEAIRLARDSYLLGEEYTLFNFYAQAYLPTIVHRSQNWKDQIGWAMDKHILPEFGHRDLRSINRGEIQLFFNKLRVSPKSARHVKTIFSTVMGLAEQDGLIERNPLQKIRLPYIPNSKHVILTGEQLRMLLAVDHPTIKPFILLAGCAGLPLGEALGSVLISNCSI